MDRVTCVVRNAQRAAEAVELGATHLAVLEDIMALPTLAAEFDCVINTSCANSHAVGWGPRAFDVPVLGSWVEL